MESAIVIKETGSELAEQGVQGIPTEWAQLPLDVLGLHGIKVSFGLLQKFLCHHALQSIAALRYGGDSIV